MTGLDRGEELSQQQEEGPKEIREERNPRRNTKHGSCCGHNNGRDPSFHNPQFINTTQQRTTAGVFETICLCSVSASLMGTLDCTPEGRSLTNQTCICTEAK